jgi:hypothetical protein
MDMMVCSVKARWALAICAAAVDWLRSGRIGRTGRTNGTPGELRSNERTLLTRPRRPRLPFLMVEGTVCALALHCRRRRARPVY